MLNLYVKTQTAMGDLKAALNNLKTDQEGASLIEYSILIGLISAAVIGLVVTVGGKVTTAWTTLSGNANW